MAMFKGIPVDEAPGGAFGGIPVEAEPEAEAAKPRRSAADIIRDIGITGLKGAVGLPQAFVGLADIPTGGRVGKALEEIGYRPADAQRILDEQYSAATQADKRYVHEADGFTETVGRAIERPATIATAVGESLPSMIGGASIARGVLKVAPKVAPVLAGAIGEGAIGAGSAAEQIRGENRDGLLTPTQSAAAVGSGAVTGILGFAGGKLAQRLGIGDIDTVLASGAGQASAKGFARQVLEAGITEGVFEELPQSAQEQMWQNFATGKPILEGVENAAAMGMLAGGVMGGAGGGYNAVLGKIADLRQPDAAPPQAQPADAVGGQAQPAALDAAEVLGAAPQPTEAERALYTPKNLTALDRVAEIDQRLSAADLSEEEGQSLRTEREAITSSWPKAVAGAPLSFSTEAGARLDGQYALMEADDLTTSHDENLRPVPTYPAELQPRERERHASELQVQQIVQRLDPARLGESADAATGAPIVGADGLVESGNARTIALKRVYQARGQKAENYRQFLRDNAARFGITPESVDALQKPVLVRVRTTPVNRAEFARQANAATVARMSPSEQARADAAMLDSLDDLQPDEAGDFLSGASRPFVRRFLAKLPTTEQAGLIDQAGNLSQSGYARIRNAVLAKAYGDSPVLLRMVESLDDNTRNLTRALMRVAPQVAKTREAIAEGALFDADITPDLVAAVEELSALKEKGVSVEQALAQAGMFGDKLTPEAAEMLAFLNENIRSPRRIADFIQAYLDALAAAGNPAQGSMFGDTAAPGKADLMAAAKRSHDAERATEDAGRRQPGEDQEAGAGNQRQPEDAPGGEGRDGGDARAREQAAADFRDALNDLGAIVRDFAHVARVVPEDTPGLMETLVRLFDAAIRLGYHDAKKAVAYVKEQLRGDARFKAIWNKIGNDTYRKAAVQAVDAAAATPAEGLFAQPTPQGRTSAESDSASGRPARQAENPIPMDETLTGEAAAIQARFRDWVWNNLDEAIAQYQAANGGVLNTDEARKLSPDYNATPETRSLYSAAVHEPASWLIKEIYRRELEQAAPEGKDDLVLFTAGGTGAGKSSAVKAALSGEAERAQIVYDTNMNGFASADKKIQQALAAGKKVSVIYVYRDPLDALVNGALPRAMNPDSESFGRTVPLREHVKTHVGASETMVKLAEKYADHPDVRLRVVDNSRGKGEQRVVPLAAVPRLSYNGIDWEAYHEAVRQEHQSRRISDAVLLGTLGAQSHPQAHDGRRVRGVGRQGGAGDGRGSEREAQRPAGPQPAALDARSEDADARAEGSAGAGNRTVESSVNERDREHGAGGAEGQGPASAPGADRQRGARRVRQGQGGGDLFADHQPGAPDGQPVRLRQDGRSDGAGADHERRAGAGQGDRAGRAAGIPAGRDIPAKSGRNYRFADGDLTYEGSWLKKAAQNVEAVELVKKLQAEGRQASREEQAVLAKFIGWGASEIRNALFGNKLDAEAAKIRQYEDARKALAEAGGESMSRYASGYMQAYYLVSGTPGYRYGDPITRALLEQAKPDMTARKWLDLRDRLKAALTAEEWATAERSTQYAHYTSRAVVQSMWKAMERMGFKGGAILEPGAGIGVFPGLMDPAMATNSVYTGIEFDAITGAILQQLFPDERILVESFVDSALPDDFYDVAIGNPPFANIPILSDPRYKKHAFSLHDYFFAKSIDKVKPGGLVVYVTSRYTMDKQGDKARKYLAERADLVGALRLPQTAFQKNAGTEVVTDILFLRKKVAGEPFAHAQPWLGVQEIQTDKGPALINEYFAAHPEMVLGTHSLSGSMYAKNEYTVLPKGGDIEANFAAAVEKLPADIYRATGSAAEAAQVREIDFNPKAQKEGNYYVSDAGVLMQREGGVGVRADAGKPEKTVALLKDFVRLRDALKQAHYDQLNDGPWEDSLKALQKAYRAFVKKHGNILQNKAFERKVTREDEETGQEIEDTVTWRRFDLLAKISDDPDYTLVEALETLNEETGEIRESKFLSERVLAKPTEARIETPHDALLSVLNDTGKVDLPLIAARLGLSEKETAAALGTAIYESPAGGWLMADEYLSGNVKKKLREAQEAARADRRFERNVEALLSAQPAPQVLEDRGLQDFDAWAAMFGQENTEIEADASGRYAPVTRFTKFVNVPELTQMFREYADVLTAEHLAEMLGDKRPKVKGGGRKLVITPQTDAYAAYKEVLAARLAESRAWKPSKDEPNNPDPIIKIIGDGRLAAIDMRFIDPSLPSDPDSKLNQMIDGVIEVYRRTAGHEYLGKDGKPEPARGGAQMVFSDLGFGAGVAEHRGFNARAWFEKRLRDAGIPPAQVAFMSDYKKSTAKLKLFQDVNAGRVRILIGSSKNMGTGVNAQQRLVALHHLDTPWYPADLEQREGRIIRQGNKNPLVEIYAYSTKGSYDTVMWQMLASKQRFIDQALSGDSSVRSIDDLTEASQFQIATAMTAGDPRAIQLAGIKADIEKLQRLFRAHEETRARLRYEYDLAGQWASSATAQLPTAEKLAGQVQNLSGENFKAKADDKAYNKRKDWGEALLAELKSRAARGTDGRVKVGEISGFPVEFVGQIVRDAGGKVKEYHSGLAMTLGEEAVWLAHDHAEDPVGMAMRATNALTALTRKPAELRQRIKDAKAKRAGLVDRLDAKFQFAQELADKLKEAEALETAMIADQAKPEQSPAPAEQDHGKADQEGGNPEQPRLSRFDRSVPGRLQAEDVRAVVDGFRKAAKNLPLIHVLQDTKDAPRAVQKELRELDAMDDAAGFYSTDGQIYLFASNLSSIEHAQRVFLHEAQHYGLEGLFGRSLDETMMYLYEHNGDLKVKADARKKADRTLSTVRAVEEVLADMAGAGKAKTLNGWDKLVAAVREWFRKAGWVGTVTDNDVAYLIYRAELYWQRAQKGGYTNVKRGKLSRAGDMPADQQLTPEQRADLIIAARAGTPRPLDAVLRGAVKAVRLDRLTTAAYEKAGALLDRYTPEVIKAGVVSDYGIPEAVLDQRAMMQGRQRQQLRGAGALIEKLATLTRAESRVAYEWLNNDDPQAAAYFEAQLPPESVKVLREVKELIDQLSREAVRLGQLDADTYQKNRYAYLRRSYVKHTAELTGAEAKGRARAIAILGDQYRGRGMTDAADMAKIKAAAPEWWGRKLQQGKADKGLRGEKFIRLERRQAVGQGVAPFPGMAAGGRKARLLEVVYWPAAEPVPARYAGWDQAGTWEVRDTKGAKLILWRDFTKQEREAMGEIDEARFAIAKTMHGMIHDVETGRYLEWLAQRYAKKEGEAIDGRVVEASERMRDIFKPGEWVKVPDTVIPGTRVKKYGVLAGRYLPGPIWNDVRQVVGFRYQPLGETYAAIHKAWKTSKTALSPAVHMNNVMANFVMADWHDVTAGHVVKALRLMLSKDAAAQAVLARYGDSGGTIGTWAAKELQQEQLRPLLDALEKELGIAGEVSGQVGAMAALQLALRGRLLSTIEAAKPTLAGRAAVKAGRAMIDLYEAEDQVFRLAAWLKAKEDGASDLEAGKAARRSFLDYGINAPWIQMMRNTAFPFIAFTYRSVPMLLETAAKKPWKLMKLGLVAGALNALGYLFSGGDEDDERKLLPEEKAGRIWGLTPKLVRMPWNDAHGSPVFLDVRRWVPVGDIFDIGQGHAAIPALPAMTPGGPLAVLAELALNKVQFTGKEITLETDTGVEKAQKVADHLYKAFAPNILILPGTYAWTAAMNAGSGKTDAFGREQSLAQAVISSVGIKVGSYPKDVLQLNAQREAQAKMMEIDRNITALKREYQRKGLDDEAFRAKVAEQQAKKRKVVEDLQGRMAR